MTADGGAGAPQGGVRCMLMRGGTSKGLYFLASEWAPPTTSTCIG